MARIPLAVILLAVIRRPGGWLASLATGSPTSQRLTRTAHLHRYRAQYYRGWNIPHQNGVSSSRIWTCHCHRLPWVCLPDCLSGLLAGCLSVRLSVPRRIKPNEGRTGAGEGKTPAGKPIQLDMQLCGCAFVCVQRCGALHVTRINTTMPSSGQAEIITTNSFEDVPSSGPESQCCLSRFRAGLWSYSGFSALLSSPPIELTCCWTGPARKTPAGPRGHRQGAPRVVAGAGIDRGRHRLPHRLLRCRSQPLPVSLPVAGALSL